MAISYLDAYSAIVTIIASAILVLALYRSIEFGRAMVGGTYKSRAIWTAVFLASTIFLLVDASGSFSDDVLPGFMVLTVALPLFINGTVKAVQESDFFHRDTLHWRTFGKATIAIAFVSVSLSGFIAITAPSSISGSSPLWWINFGFVQFFIIQVVISIYGAISLLLAARNTQDRTMKRFVRLLGFSLLGLFFFLTVWIPIDYFAPGVGDAISYLGFIIAAYFLYRAVMSLSPLGKMETEQTTNAAGLPGK